MKLRLAIKIVKITCKMFFYVRSKTNSMYELFGLIISKHFQITMQTLLYIDKDEVCYWCGKLETSREHVPPKCLFPEGKDVKE
ncbi:hypothetical protein [Clostridium botulinum]|uniref:hypothetical protein n=1 Tax=Clostridium botulinum TaxID=1491 RepID=UPI0024924D01|nr:hypothetical protein [Clostridium botulinum]